VFIALLMTAVFVLFVWLVFFQFKWLAWSIPSALANRIDLHLAIGGSFDAASATGVPQP